MIVDCRTLILIMTVNFSMPMAQITTQPQVKYHHLRPNGYHGVDEEAVGHLAPRCDHICVGLGTRLELSNNFTSSMQHR